MHRGGVVRTDVLAWNPLAHRLLAGHYELGAPERPAERRNLTRMLFLDPHTRELYPRLREEAAQAVASLRLIAGRFPEDRELAELIGELTVKSSQFATLWAKHPVRECMAGSKHLHHPEVGELELAFQALPGDSGQRLFTYTAAGPSEAALRLLAG